MKSNKAGFTLVEMIISMALLLIVFVVIGKMLNSTTRTYQDTADVAKEVEITDAAARLLRYDISLAGYIGLDGVERDLGGDAVIVTPRDDTNLGEIIEVRYYEDRYTLNGEPELRHISYYVGQNEEGYGLLRNDHTLDPQLLMKSVDSLMTEDQPRGINLNLSRYGSVQLVRIAYNIPDIKLRGSR